MQFFKSFVSSTDNNLAALLQDTQANSRFLDLAGKISKPYFRRFDVNSDGIGDLLIGAIWASPGGQTQAGITYVIFGKSSGWTATLDLALSVVVLGAS